MELRHLRYAIAVAEELNFGRAAERLHMSQPPLSQQIRQIEEELGVQLFERTKRSVKLTPAGETFVAEGRSILKHIDDAQKATVRTARGEIGTLMVGTVTSTDSGFYNAIVEILQKFAGQYPDVHLGLRTLSSGQQMQDVKEGRLTGGFVNLPVDDPELDVRHVHSEPLVVALPEKHPLGKRPKVSARALAREPNVLGPRHLSPAYFDLVVAYFQKTGYPLNVVHEADNIYTTLALVAAGVGAALFPASLLNVPRKGIVVRKLDPPPPPMSMGFVYRRNDKSAILHSFLTVLDKVLRKKK
jgi:DNA-binding transcriptional LysR family regulator